MEAKIVLIHVDGGIPTAYTNDGSIIIAMRDEDLGKYSWDDQEELDKQEPSYEFLVSKLKEAEVVGTDDAKGRLFSPAPIDWGKEAARLGQMREKAIEEIHEMNIPEGGIEIPRTPITCYNLVRKVKDYVFVANGRVEEAELVNTIDTASLICILGSLKKAIAQ